MQRFKNILCVVDTSIKDNAALEHAVSLAENNQASLTVIEVIDEIPPNTKLFERTLSSVDIQEKILTEHQEKLDEMISPWTAKIDITSKVLVGISFLEVIHEVLCNEHDLVFKTVESSGILNRLLGSDDMHLLRKCPCPLWLVKSKSPKTYQQILAAVDVDENYLSEELNTRHSLNLQILEMAISLALSESATLHITHAWESIAEDALRTWFVQLSEEKFNAYAQEIKQQHSENMTALINEAVNKLGRDALEYLKPQTHLLEGAPRKMLPAFANETHVDLVVMGTVARTGISGFFMGNTAESILNQLDCSVLAIKPPGFETPVTLEG